LRAGGKRKAVALMGLTGSAGFHWLPPEIPQTRGHRLRGLRAGGKRKAVALMGLAGGAGFHWLPPEIPQTRGHRLRGLRAGGKRKAVALMGLTGGAGFHWLPPEIPQTAGVDPAACVRAGTGHKALWLAYQTALWSLIRCLLVCRQRISTNPHTGEG